MTVAPVNLSTTYRRPEGIEAAVYRLGLGLVAWVAARARLDENAREASARRGSTARAAESAYDAARSRAAMTRIV